MRTRDFIVVLSLIVVVTVILCISITRQHENTKEVCKTQSIHMIKVQPAHAITNSLIIEDVESCQ